MSRKLEGKTALITGGSRGIGAAIAKRLASEGANVAITYAKDAASATEVVKAIEINGGKAIAIKADGGDVAAVKAAVGKTVETFGQLDVLVANAGVGHLVPIENLTSKEWHETIDTNLTGVFNSVKGSLDALKKSKGYIITIASLAGANFFANGAAYNASKFGLVGFSQAIMLDLRQYGIKVTTIMPGSVATNFNNHEVSDSDWRSSRQLIDSFPARGVRVGNL